MEHENRVILRTYSGMWRYEIKIYAIDNIRLIVPVNPNELGFFLVGLLLVFFLGKIFPPFTAVPFLIRIVILPYFLMKFLTKKKFDGKLPHKFLLSYAQYLAQPKALARFTPAQVLKPGAFTAAAFRGRYAVDTTLMAQENRRKKHVRVSSKIL